MDAAGLERIVSESNKEAKDALERIRNNSEKNSRNRKRNSKNLIIAGLIGASIFASYRTISYAGKKAIDFITEKAEAAADYISEHPIYSIQLPGWLSGKSPEPEQQARQYETKTAVSENASSSGKSAEQTAAEMQEAERISAETQESERAAAEKAAAEKEAERIAAEKAAEKAAADRIAAQKKEAARIAAEKKAALDKTQQKANFEKDLRERFDDVFSIDSPSLQQHMPSMYKRFASKTEWTQLYSMLRAVDVLTSKQADSLATLVDGNLSNGELSNNPKFYMTTDKFSIYTELKSPYGSYFAKLFIHLDGEDWDAFNERCKRAKTLLFGKN
jgi:chemotaxis protein histidine kinase CheA